MKSQFAVFLVLCLTSLDAADIVEVQPASTITTTAPSTRTIVPNYYSVPKTISNSVSVTNVTPSGTDFSRSPKLITKLVPLEKVVPSSNEVPKIVWETDNDTVPDNETSSTTFQYASPEVVLIRKNPKLKTTFEPLEKVIPKVGNDIVPNHHTTSTISQYVSTTEAVVNSTSAVRSREHVEYVLLDNDKHPCARTCVEGEPPMICRYHFKLENYYTLTKACYDCPRNKTDCFRNDCVPGDGSRRAVYTVNRRIPGPNIQVCQNDLIVVDLENHLMAESTTIHWHGQHQKDTPYMDGVPYVTQCPIPPRTTFRYSFKATQSGTHFWHSHMGMQRVDGCFGSLIVKVPSERNPHDSLYHFDLSSHVMVLIDWEKETGMDKFLSHHHSIGNNKPATLLVNGLGRGRFKEVETSDGKNRTVYTPLARFQVEKGYKYRFRVINAGFLNCPIEISVDNHTLTVIASDGGDLEPIEVESLVTYAGERFDFVLTPDQPRDLYWIRYRGLMDCDERFTRAHQVAVLEYKDFNKTFYNELSNNIDSDLIDDVEYLPMGNPNYDNSRREGKQLNALNRGTEGNKTLYVSMPELKSLRGWDSSLKAKADVQIYLAYDFYRLDNDHFHKPGYEFFNMTSVDNQLLTPQFNHISMKIPSFPLLSQRNEIPFSFFCNQENIKPNCATEYCECPHGYEIPLNAVVELVLVDEGFAYDANHPLHLHGYSFRVVAMERLARNVTVEEIKQRDQEGLIKRNLQDAPFKDTVTVPDGGYTVVRFHAQNPGYWIFHCHIEFHAEIGMALIFKVGKNAEMRPVPEDFPKCGNYLPKESYDTTTIGQNDTSLKPSCSKSAFLNSFEKYILGNDCVEKNSAVGKFVKSGGLLVGFILVLGIFH